MVRQVFNVCTSPVVQSAWKSGQKLAIHGLVYNVHNGRLEVLHALCQNHGDAPPVLPKVPLPSNKTAAATEQFLFNARAISLASGTFHVVDFASAPMQKQNRPSGIHLEFTSCYK